ncbi:thiamine pyrophosphate-dependent enzyme [Virgisporangium aurantiacum]|nr:thiamine pyrophosphate-dependent enzyme [Virgisporangium aurantiacum]
MLSRVTTPQDLDERFHAELAQLRPTESPADPDEPVREGSGLTGTLARELFQAQLVSRHLDLAARWLRSFDEGFHTIGSAGHEGNAAVAAAVSPADPALLHHRSGAFYCARAAQVPGTDPMRDVLRGLVASANEPIAGGRQKVFGNADLRIIPTTTTAAAHLPRAVGLAYAIEANGHAHVRPEKSADGATPADDIDQRGRYAPEAIVVCSFGDAAVNHATATAAFNTAGWFDHRGEKLPLLFVCEDNGLGVSVASPEGWVPAMLRSRIGLTYFEADGCDLAAAYDAAAEAAAFVRTERRPAVLRLTTVRLMGHDGADDESVYRTPAQIAADVGRDPLVATAKMLVDAGVATPTELVAQYDEVGWEVRRVAEEVLAEPKLASAAEITAPLAPRRPVRVARAIGAAAQVLEGAGEDRARGTAGKLPEQAGGLTLAQTINATLADALISSPGTVVFGADVALKGGVHGVTKDLRDRFGARRVFDTLLDETSIIGLGIGAGLGGLLPVPEIRYLSYVHSALDQVRGEAATMQFLSVGAFRNPLVLRIAGLGYGGPSGNDNAVAALRDIPGLVIAVPARAEDAGPMLRTCIAAAQVDGSVCVFLEPIALYDLKDLYEDGDGLWRGEYDPPGEWTTRHVPIGRARVYPAAGSSDDVTIITFGNGVRLSLRAAARLAEEGIGCRVLDLRWIGPLPVADIIRESAATGRVLVVDETRRSGGVGEGVIAALVDAGYVGVARRVAAVDSFIPLGPAARHVLVSEEQIVQGVRSLLAR